MCELPDAERTELLGELVASLSVSGPTFRFDQARHEQVLTPLRAEADEVGIRLGWRPASA